MTGTVYTAFGKSVSYDELAATVSLNRLITLGLSTALKNSHAGLEAKLRKENANISEEAVKKAIADRMDAKFKAIVAGEWNAREASGTALTARDKLIRQIGMDELRARLKAAGYKWNADKGATEAAKEEHLAAREAAYDKLAAKRLSAWEAEADRRLAATVPTDDEDDIFADIMPAKAAPEGDDEDADEDEDA